MSASQTTTEVATAATNGITQSTTQTRPEYPIGVPEKVSVDGIFQPYPGNTTVCHIPQDSPLQPGLRALYAAVRDHPVLSQKLRLLPPSSWHMTVFDCVREKECEPGMWPPGKEKQGVKESSKEFSTLLRGLGLQLAKEGLAPPYNMKVRNYDAAVVGIGLEVVGATEEEEARLRRLRDRIAETLGFKAPNHYTYQFHVSMAYLLRHIDGENRQMLNEVFKAYEAQIMVEFELGMVEFCTFDDMLAFPRLFYLGDEE